jgi:Xaa-Pro dipeptidase
MAAEINYLIQKEGASPAFDTIVAFGKNSSQPHYLTGNEKLEEGDIALMDFGACYKRYRSDVTRTFIYGEDEEKKEMYDTVAKAQKIGIEMMKEGMMTVDIYKTAKEFIDKTKFKGKFIHALGHSIGLEVHDGGSIALSSEIELKEGMIFTVEPGIYVPRAGGVRIEDDVLVKKGRAEILTA